MAGLQPTTLATQAESDLFLFPLPFSIFFFYFVTYVLPA